MNLDNAVEYIEAGASHVIVTSFVFRDGRLEEDRLKALVGNFCHYMASMGNLSYLLLTPSC